MTALSTATWTAHELGVATAVGGTMFGRAALQPALQEIEDPESRDRFATAAWTRFSWLNLAANGVVAATWFASGSLLGGRRAGGSARSLVRIKDGLVIASLASGICRAVLGRVLAKRTLDEHDHGENVIADANRAWRKHDAARRAVGVAGIVNLLANVAILGMDTELAVEGRRSIRSRVLG